MNRISSVFYCKNTMCSTMFINNYQYHQLYPNIPLEIPNNYTELYSHVINDDILININASDLVLHDMKAFIPITLILLVFIYIYPQNNLI